MSDADKPRGRARGRGRGQSPPPPGEHRPFPPQQAMPRHRMPHQPGVQVRPGMQPMAPQHVQGMVQPRLMMAPRQQQPQRPMMQQQQRPMMQQQQQQRPMMQQQQQQRPMMQQQQQRPMMQQQQQRPVMQQQQQQRPVMQQQQQQRPVMQQQQPMAAQSALDPVGPQQPVGMMTHPPALRPTANVRPALPCQPRTSAPLQPAQQATQLQMTPRVATSRQLAAQESAATTAVARPDTSQSRAFYRGSERVQSATQRAMQASDDAALATQLGAMAVQEGSEGNGSSGGNGNGNDAVSVGRGMSRGGGRRLEGQLPVLRPHNNTKIGKGGRAAVKLLVNYFELEKGDEWHLYQYDIQYQPEQDDRSNRFKIMENHFKHFAGHVFDGQAIFSAVRLTNKVTTYTTKLGDDVYTATVTMIKELNSLDEQFIRFLNLILRRCQNHIGLKLIGRQYFKTDDAISLGPDLKMRVFPGYQTSIRQHEEKMLINVDIVHKFQQQTSLLTVLSKFSSVDTRNDTINGSIVMARYNHLTYRVEGIADNMTPQSTFKLKNGEDTSYIEYYRKKHGIVITNVKQPLIEAMTKQRGIPEKIYLVPELLTLTGIPDDMRRNYNQMKMLADYTKMGVDKRVAALKRFNQTLLSNERVKEDLAKWGLKLSPNLVSIDSRMLEYENVQLERTMTNHPPDSADWTTQCRNQGMAYTVHLKNWVVLVHKRHANELQEFLVVLNRAGQSVGMNMDRPEVQQYHSVGNCEMQLGDHAGRQMVMIILDNSMKQNTKYGQLKKRLACQLGVLSQFVLCNSMGKKGVMSIATKIAIQMNAKLGGEPWRIIQPAKTAMVVGYDVYHDSMSRNKSYGAVVSSINPQCTRYFGQVNAHHNKEELSDKFSTSIRNAVDQYHRSNGGKYPATMIIYRDGVGEGQLDYVKEHEIPAIKRQLAAFGAEVKIALIFVVVCKRINTRMFAEFRGKLVNPSPGTVLDKVVTLPNQYDFFLVSQKVTQGTVTPTSYNVLEDTTKLSVDQVQRLTYKFTHLYFNWQGTVRVPAPCLYAHKLAYITGTGTHELPKPKLTDKLWFI